MPRIETTPNRAPPSEDHETAREPGRWSLRGGAVAAVLTFAVMVATEPLLAIVWDEGYTLGRERRIRSWLSALADPSGFAENWTAPGMELVQPDGPTPEGIAPVPVPTAEQIDTRLELFDPMVLAYFWPFAREEPHGHPPFYAILGLAGDMLTPWRAELERARLGPILLFSFAVGAIFAFLDRRRGRWAAVVGASAMVLQPRLFGHAHYAAYDAPLTCLWALAVLAFAAATEETARRSPRWGWAAVLGLILGASAATKLTGWFLPLGLVAWALIYRDRRALLTLAVAGPVALATLYALVPPWWPDPVVGFARFLASNTGRGESIPIRTLYLGKIYQTPIESLPMDNALVWTAFVTPIGLLGLALVGAIRSAVAHQSERFGTLVALQWLTLIGLRALPGVPGHDGVRLFLPAFGMLAIAAGLGAGLIVGWLGIWGRVLVIAAVVEAGVGLASIMPVPLSYYSTAVGGLPGAVKFGMEPTYYWDALTDDAIDWLNAQTPEGHRVATSTFPTSFLYLNESGRLRPSIAPFDPETPAWFVVQNRPGSMSQPERSMVRNREPAYRYDKQGVPLLWIFPVEEPERRPRRVGNVFRAIPEFPVE